MFFHSALHGGAAGDRTIGHDELGVALFEGYRGHYTSTEGIHLNSFYEVQHLSTSLGLVESGLGVAILPRMTMPGPDHDTLCSRDLPEPRIQRSIGLVRSNSSR